MSDPHLLRISDQCHIVLHLEQPYQIVLIDEEVADHGFQRQLLAVMLVQEGLDDRNIYLLRRIRTIYLDGRRIPAEASADHSTSR